VIVRFLKITKSLQTEFATAASLVEGQYLKDGLTWNKGTSQRVLEVPYANWNASNVYGRWTRFRGRDNWHLLSCSVLSSGGSSSGGGGYWYELEVYAVQSRVCEFSSFNFFLVNICISLFCESFMVLQSQQYLEDNNLGNTTDDIHGCDKFWNSCNVHWSTFQPSDHIN
jgi:hypothetical protein